MYYVVICVDGDVRLVDGSIPSEGRVEICSGNTWLVVCDNPANFQRANRDHLICRQLGYDNMLHKLRGLSQGSNSYLLRDWYCVGNESNLLDCPFSNVDDFQCNVAGVACENVVGKFSYIDEIYIHTFLICSHFPLYIDGCRMYPSYLNFDNDVCEETCPNGTFGVTNGTVNDLTTDRLRACTPSKYTEILNKGIINYFRKPFHRQISCMV